jgi:hypothetical protein
MDDYATVGGKWARTHPAEGTVGSVFSDPGTILASHDARAHHDVDPPRPVPPQIDENYPLEALTPGVESILRHQGRSEIIVLE